MSGICAASIAMAWNSFLCAHVVVIYCRPLELLVLSNDVDLEILCTVRPQTDQVLKVMASKVKVTEDISKNPFLN